MKQMPEMGKIGKTLTLKRRKMGKNLAEKREREKYHPTKKPSMGQKSRILINEERKGMDS